MRKSELSSAVLFFGLACIYLYYYYYSRNMWRNFVDGSQVKQICLIPMESTFLCWNGSAFFRWLCSLQGSVISMEMMRGVGTGSAEFLGPWLLEIDNFFRNPGLQNTLEKAPEFYKLNRALENRTATSPVGSINLLQRQSANGYYPTWRKTRDFHPYPAITVLLFSFANCGKHDLDSQNLS